MQLILWPALITLAITLLRLVGELQGWSPALFNRAAGGGGALVGISWLPVVLGPYFAWQLVRAGRGPRSAWKAVGLAALGFALMVGSFGAAQRFGTGAILAALVAGLVAGFIPWQAWPDLARTLFAYALAARVPVAILMLVAIYGQWGTHYDVLPPDPPARLVAMGPLGQWFYIGLLPQMTLWIGFTVLAGTLFGGLVVALAKPKRAPGVA